MKTQEQKENTKITIAENLKIALMKFVVILAVAFIGFLIINRFDIVIL